MSGMRLHVTSELRAHDIGNVQIGQNAIAIPADTNNYVTSGECPSSCTGVMLPRPIYITEIYLHMHGLGTVKCVFCLHNIITTLYRYGDFLWCFCFAYITYVDIYTQTIYMEWSFIWYPFVNFRTDHVQVVSKSEYNSSVNLYSHSAYYCLQWHCSLYALVLLTK